MKEFFKNNIFYSILFWINYVFISLLLVGVPALVVFAYVEKEALFFIGIFGLILFVWLVFEWYLSFREYKKIKNNEFQKAGWKNYLKLLFYFILNLVLTVLFLFPIIFPFLGS